MYALIVCGINTDVVRAVRPYTTLFFPPSGSGTPIPSVATILKLEHALEPRGCRAC